MRDQVIESMVAQQLEDNENQVEKKELEQKEIGKRDAQRIEDDKEMIIQPSGILWRRKASDPREDEHQLIGLNSETVTPPVLWKKYLMKQEYFQAVRNLFWLVWTACTRERLYLVLKEVNLVAVG